MQKERDDVRNEIIEKAKTKWQEWTAIAVAQMIFILPDAGVSAFIADANFSRITGSHGFCE